MEDKVIAIHVRETPLGWFIIFQEKFIGPFSSRTEAIKVATSTAKTYAESHDSYINNVVAIELPNKEFMP